MSRFGAEIDAVVAAMVITPWHRGTVQLAVTHHARAQAEDREHVERFRDGAVAQPEAALNGEEERSC